MGEPLICPFLSELVKYAHDLGYRYIYIDTNGILATPDIINPIVDAGLDSIKFSVHAITSETYKKINQTDNFGRVMSNIKDLNQYKKEHNLSFRFITYFAETTLNTHEKECFQTEMAKYGEVWISPIHNGSGVLDEQNAKIAVTEDISCFKGDVHRCSEPFDRINISWDGKAMACCTDWTGSLVYGSARENTLNQLWNNDKMRCFRENLLSGNLCDICADCIGSGLQGDI